MTMEPSNDDAAGCGHVESESFTKEDFMREYAKGSQMYIDLDPRIDLTQPVYEQVLRLRALDEAAENEKAKPHKAA